MNWIAVVAGGALGAALRYAVGSLWLAGAFPWGTLVVNVTGSFALGFLARYFGPPHASHTAFLFLTVGLCGGYTTFSTFTLDTFALVEGRAVLRALAYVAASVLISYTALVLGYHLARLIRPV
jgi:CrcB protein